MNCPVCGSEKVVPILYGLPDATAPLPAGVVLGGCCIGPHDLACKTCGGMVR